MIKRLARYVMAPLLWRYSSAELGLANIFWSQFGEDILVRNCFPSDYRGTYVDVGAFHPIYLSNTYALYRNGWNGLAIDANEGMRPLFEKFRSRDQFVHSAVGIEGQVKMTMFHQGAFNCVEKHADTVPPQFRKDVRSVVVQSQRLAVILEKCRIERIDFLNIDCEGADLEILESNDWLRWRPQVICVEDHDREWQTSDVSRFLEKHDYQILYRAGLSSLFKTTRPE